MSICICHVCETYFDQDIDPVCWTLQVGAGVHEVPVCGRCRDELGLEEDE